MGTISSNIVCNKKYEMDVVTMDKVDRKNLLTFIDISNKMEAN